MLFDRYVVVDWSAKNSPATGKDSIWIAVLDTDGDVELSNPPTRAAAADQLDAIIAATAGRPLITVDANLGYPCGTAHLLGLAGVPWRATWAEVDRLSTDDERNRNNRFDVAGKLNRRAGSIGGPFWGCPPAASTTDLHPTKPAAFPIDEFRAVEHRLRAAGRYPKSVWQLFGVGSVGGQTLTLLPVLYRLLDRVDVWPFTSGWGVPTGRRPVIAEIWPSLFVEQTPVGTIVDAAQVTGTAEALRDDDRSGALADWFARPAGATDAQRDEEGWMLGAALV